MSTVSIVAVLSLAPWAEQQSMKPIVFLVILTQDSQQVQPLSTLQAFLEWQCKNAKTGLKKDIDEIWRAKFLHSQSVITKMPMIVIVAVHTLVPWAVPEQVGLFNVLSFLSQCYLWLCMDKLLTGLNLGRVFNFRSDSLPAALVWCYRVKLPNLKLKTQPKQLLVLSH